MNREAERKRLVELFQSKSCWHNDCEFECFKCDNIRIVNREIEIIVDHLLDNGIVVPPDELYSIVDKGTIYATVSKAMVDWLPLYVVKEPEKYGYYRTREQALKALEGKGE